MIHLECIGRSRLLPPPPTDFRGLPGIRHRLTRCAEFETLDATAKSDNTNSFTVVEASGSLVARSSCGPNYQSPKSGKCLLA